MCVLCVKYIFITIYVHKNLNKWFTANTMKILNMKHDMVFAQNLVNFMVFCKMDEHVNRIFICIKILS